VIVIALMCNSVLTLVMSVVSRLRQSFDLLLVLITIIQHEFDVM